MNTGLLGILQIADEYGVDAVRFKSINTFDIYDEEKLDIKPEELLEQLKKTEESAREIQTEHNLKNIITNFGNYRRPEGKHPCYIPWLEVYIQWYGGVRLCCEFYSKKYDFGNILKEDFRTIWNSQKMQKVRHEFKKGNLPFPVCENCNVFAPNLIIEKKVQKVKKLIPFI